MGRMKTEVFKDVPKAPDCLSNGAEFGHPCAHVNSDMIVDYVNMKIAIT